MRLKNIIGYSLLILVGLAVVMLGVAEFGWKTAIISVSIAVTLFGLLVLGVKLIDKN